MTNCPILGCNLLFVNGDDAELHSATSWHCIGCGISDDRELTTDNIGEHCECCSTQAMEDLCQN